MLRQLPDDAGCTQAYNARKQRSRGLREGHPLRIGCNIRRGVCVLLANSWRRKGHWSGLLKYLLLESILSPRFWTVGILLFGLPFAASRGSTVLRVLFFWIPTITVSALGFLIVAAYAYLFAISRHP